MTIIDQLKRDEGLKLKPYKDTVGKITIGVGRNLTDNGISDDEAFFLLRNDVDRVVRLLNNAGYIPDPLISNDPRFAVLVNICFNIGPEFLTWRKTLGFYSAGDFENCSKEILSSEPWASQVGSRANRLSQQMRTGVWT